MNYISMRTRFSYPTLAGRFATRRGHGDWRGFAENRSHSLQNFVPALQPEPRGTKGPASAPAAPARLASNFIGVQFGVALEACRKNHKIASNVRLGNNFLKTILGQTCSRRLCEPDPVGTT